MKTPLKRIRLGAIVLVVILLVAIGGYRYTGRTWIQSIYMVVITISSVGYREGPSQLSEAEQLFTVGVIIFGMSAAAYTVGGLIQMMTEGEIQRALGHRRMTRDIQQLKDHVIICGYGRIGQMLAQEFHRQKQPFLVIDNDPERVVEAQDHDRLVLSDDATKEEVLLAAGVDRAKALVSGLPNDAANVFITLTSRDLNRNLQIIARAEHRTTEKKLIQAGADRVVMPAVIGAQQMVRMITRPTTADLMALVTDRSILDVELDEISISGESKLAGMSVRDAEAHRRHGLLVVAVKQAGGQMVFNPDADYQFHETDTLIVMGRTTDIEEFRDRYGL